MTGARGPVPKRTAQRRRTNKKPPVDTTAPVDTSLTPTRGKRVEPPVPSADWHEAAMQWYLSLADSGQSVWYTMSDWRTAWATAEMLSREFEPKPMRIGSGENAHVEMVRGPFNAASFSAFLKACSQLLATEGDRRRVAIELQRDGLIPAEGGGGTNVSEIDEWRKRLAGSA